MHLSVVDQWLWAIGFVGEAILVFVLIFRGRIPSFPVFSSLVFFSFTRTWTTYLIYRYASAAVYYYTYWALGLVDMMIQLGIVYEIARRVFAPLGQWAPDVRNSFIRLVGGSVLLGVILTELAAPARRLPFERTVVRGTFFSSALMTELFVGMLALSAAAGLPWRTHVSRIAQGMGVKCFVDVLLDTASSWLRWDQQGDLLHALSEIRIATWLIVVGYWIVTLWQEAPQPARMSGTMRLQIFSLQRQVEYDLGRIRGWRKV